jgi:large subunit ribosomal protein L21
MYAIIEIAGFDYKVKPGDKITVPHLPNQPGEELEFSKVKLLKDEKEVILSPKASVKAKVLGHRRGKKVIVYKFKRRKGYRRKQGYRDTLTDLEVTAITPEK